MHKIEKNMPNCQAMRFELLRTGREKEQVHNHNSYREGLWKCLHMERWSVMGSMTANF
jgi:hypothetical protein